MIFRLLCSASLPPEKPEGFYYEIAQLVGKGQFYLVKALFQHFYVTVFGV